MKEFDFIVIGGGAGSKLAFSLSEKGYRTAIIDRDVLGGTCLNYGCIPSKMLIHTAEIADQIKKADRFNLHISKAYCNFKALVQRVNRTIAKESRAMAKNAKEIKNLEYIRHSAEFLDSHTLLVGTKKIRGEKIILATGVHPTIPPIEGLNLVPYLTSKQALRVETLPKRLAILGGGYIAAELGFYFAALGSQVTILTRRDFLSKEDPDIREEFLRLFQQDVNVLTQSPIQSVRLRNQTIVLSTRKKRIEADQLLIATGVEPTTNKLKLENTQVQTDERGFIRVNSRLQTKEKHIWALGDVIGPPFFRHKANFEAQYLESELFAKQAKSIRYPQIPYAIFSNPQIAGVGKAESDLKKGSYFIGKGKYQESARGMAIQTEGGFVKLLFEKKTQKLLGARIVGKEASTLSHILSAFLEKRATLSDLLNIIYTHPSLAEVIHHAAQSASW